MILKLIFPQIYKGEKMNTKTEFNNELDFSDAPIFDDKTRYFKQTLNLLYQTTQFNATPRIPTIIEVGCTRQINDVGAGNSSELFAWFVDKYGGNFISIDNNQKHANLCNNLIKKYNTEGNVWCICADGVHMLKERFCTESRGKEGGPSREYLDVDLLYLDSMDASPDNYILAAHHHLDLFLAAENKIKEGTLILIDDIYNPITYAGKGYKLIPYLLNKKYKCIYRGYQFLFQVTEG